jgi:hypothetical protein
MSQSPDLRELLRDWPYDPEKAIRIVPGADGRDVMQVRTPLGIEQFELDGRPDGRRPHHYESALDYHIARLEKGRQSDPDATFHLSHTECAELFEEGVLYYFRYLHLFQMEDWPRTARDTTRNLALFDFVHQYAHRKDDRLHLEQWRPYVLRVNTVARAMIEIGEHAHERALQILRDGIEKIEGLTEPDNETFHTERDRSLQAIRETIEQIEKSKPLTELEKLERALHAAVESQAFERAAELRDRIRELRTIPAR